jgi:ribosome-binding protein aMBF1 (putative translation factor)
MAKRLDIAEQLRRAIAEVEKGGMTRYRIAQVARTTDAQVKRIAEGTIMPRLDTAATLADAIGYRLELVKK